MKTVYVAGLFFGQERTRVAMIRKNRPEWQKGKLNAIGGKVEKDELREDAMIREFKEETGVLIRDWNYFLCLEGRDYVVHFFTHFSSVDGSIWQLQSTTDEEVLPYLVSIVLGSAKDQIIPNLIWIIPLALSGSSGVVNEEIQ